MSAATLTIAREGVRLYLQDAGELAEASEHLYKMYFARTKDSPARAAIWIGRCAAQREAERAVEKLRERGGLLHFGAAQVDYAEGQYLVRGLQLQEGGAR